MNRIATRSILVILCSFAFLLISLPASAQDAENLLTNPGFEDPFVEFDGNPPRLVAEGWTPYHTEAAATDPGYQNQQP
ncbi:MAG: hypothetical protein H7175_09695, partial [Burkholderiales bacterium]|nr:hypothetical protein [Anaerolineae bacterium]